MHLFSAHKTEKTFHKGRKLKGALLENWDRDKKFSGHSKGQSASETETDCLRQSIKPNHARQTGRNMERMRKTSKQRKWCGRTDVGLPRRDIQPLDVKRKRGMTQSHVKLVTRSKILKARRYGHVKATQKTRIKGQKKN